MLGMKVGQAVVIEIVGNNDRNDDVIGAVTNSPSPDVVSILRRGDTTIHIALAHIAAWSLFP